MDRYASVLPATFQFLVKSNKVAYNQRQKNLPEVLQVRVDVFILQQLTLDEVVPQAELWHGQYLSFVRRGVPGGTDQVIPVLAAREALTAHHKGEKTVRHGGHSQGEIKNSIIPSILSGFLFPR